MTTEGETADTAGRIEHFDTKRGELTILLPPSSEALIDEAEFHADERLPYWAELWPAARALARHLDDLPGLPGRALELGCGVGLPSLILLGRGVDVLATDYYEDALRFARENARRNALPTLETRLLDWRAPPAGLAPFPLAVAADVLYEARNADALLALLPEVLRPGGALLLADPGRTHLARFLKGAAGAGWRIVELGVREEPAPVAPAKVRVQLVLVLLPSPDHTETTRSFAPA